jgi:DNA topoisomerase IB
LPNGVKVCLVNGEKVRDETKTDFMEGGHDLVYPWLPPKTIIFESGLHPDELPLILVHEAIERRKMANGMKYPRAHLYAAKEEWTARQHGAPDWAKELVTLGHCLDDPQAAADKPCPVCGEQIPSRGVCPKCHYAQRSVHSFPLSAVERTVYAASGPGVQQDLSAGDQLAMAFGHVHQARITNLPTQYDQLSGPEVLEPGVRVTFAMHPQTLDKQPIAVQFDSTKFTEDEARAWLAARNISEYTFLPDARDQTPTTQGNPRAEGEKPPEGFSDLNSFYSATLPVENDEQGSGSKRASPVGDQDVIRAGDEVEWITVNGAHIPIEPGQSKEDAVKENLAKHEAEKAAAAPAKEPPKIGRPAAAGSIKTSRGEELHGTTLGPDRTRTITATGEKVPEHIQKLCIPPGAHEVHVNLDPKGDRLAQWTDEKGRVQMKYGETHNAAAASNKWGREASARAERGRIKSEIAADQAAGKNSEEAATLHLIMDTGMRPGSDSDTKATHKSYGATTLEGRHIVQDEHGNVSIKFVPGKKKGQEIEMPIHDKVLAQHLLDRAAKTGPNGRIFNTSANKVRTYSKSKGSGGIKTKDHRTALGTETAIAAVKSMPAPTSQKEYKASVKAVGEKVAGVLGNTPEVAVKSYINPSVFLGWQGALKS